MRYEYINPFLISTIWVLDNVIQSDITKGSVSLVKTKEIRGEIAIVIKLNGYSEGSIIVNMETDTALNICNIMNEESLESLTSLGMDTVSELANMIVGNAASRLNDLGFDFVVTPPLVVTKDYITRKMPGLEIMQIPLFTDCGEITVNISMRTN